MENKEKAEWIAIESLNGEIEYLLHQMYEITKAESPEDMFNIAYDSLKHFGRDCFKKDQ